MRLRAALVVASLLSACQGASEPLEACAPLGLSKPELMNLREASFEGVASYDRFAQELLTCLGDPDPDLRDLVAYEAYAHMLRNKLVGKESIRSLNEALQSLLTGPDPEGFRRPFAALALSEVARADLFDEAFTLEEREALIDAAAAYIRGVSDYRGYDEKEGWRHGVAHGADLLMQLSRNETLTRDQLLKIRDAVAAQVTPVEHFYIYGEGERLARPILFIAMRNVFTEEEWSAWFASLRADENAPLTQAKLAHEHNLKSFIEPLYISASRSEAAGLKALATGAAPAL